LIVFTCAALAYTAQKTQPQPHVKPINNIIKGKNGIVTISGHLTQEKIFKGGDGNASLSLTIKADNVIMENKGKNNVDMVIVLDRSGSMQGKKIQDAKTSVKNLISQLGTNDRFALVTYSSGVQTHSELMLMTPSNQDFMQQKVNSIHPGGGTNMGAGLQAGINILNNAAKKGNLGRLILISDGLANEGITNPKALGNMASSALKNEFAISTVGVGSDFNEQLMTSLADRGTGNYYYLENPNAFAEVFQNEFHKTQTSVATGVKIEIPLNNSISLTGASGYPIEIKNNTAVFYPGDLRSGQSRNLFLTFKLPVNSEKVFEINNISTIYQYKGQNYSASLTDPFRIACVADKKSVISSIKKDVWERKVIKEDYNKLKDEVAADIKAGKQEAAMQRIQEYQGKNQALNEVVKSPAVKANLQKAVRSLRDVVVSTFDGEQEEVAMKQKMNSKALQFEAYKEQRK
ncbi:VWA domain-containing protein, partial [Desulfobacterales bacterium HSG17]|nr:VWA domain-containing protein [Desulfobacterales bacterium HSG17]